LVLGSGYRRCFSELPGAGPPAEEERRGRSEGRGKKRSTTKNLALMLAVVAFVAVPAVAASPWTTFEYS
jgi:hypothetical protein